MSDIQNLVNNFYAERTIANFNKLQDNPEITYHVCWYVVRNSLGDFSDEIRLEAYKKGKNLAQDLQHDIHFCKLLRAIRQSRPTDSLIPLFPKDLPDLSLTDVHQIGLC